MYRKHEQITFFISFLPPFLVGLLSLLLSASGMWKSYHTLVTPPLTPHPVFYFLVWFLLYLLMGASTYLILTTHTYQDAKTQALIIFGGQLALNFILPLVFFRLEFHGLTLLILLLLFILIGINALVYYRINKVAGSLLVPYLLWIFILFYLNIAILILN